MLFFVFFDPIISHSATRMLIIVVRTIPSQTATTLVVINNLVNLLFNGHGFVFSRLNLGYHNDYWLENNLLFDSIRLT